MPITPVLHGTAGRLSVVAEGHVEYADIFEHLNQERDAGCLACPELIDGTGATLVLSSSDVRKIVEQLRSLGGSHSLGPTAVLVTSDFAFGMMRMLEILIGDVCDIRPFRDRLEAEAWLALTPARMPTTETA